ncbi:Crp/Fnr family transcriptional regulator [Sinisalibacter aestuarii]|uniref:Crp/Fnr family transcriptional regulator n=1 Tax=Sinisalibacter aestuarii TaxID=2949426 RepID=A0ABQ5LXJ9_9RHOB|nr:Crp/Fnr family transcriptional regulator [Sinisalibacter aestuarii]GKY89125.1 Crp/Fnr family transcriptional regulator [Sinisalibacter aestuarii]
MKREYIEVARQAALLSTAPDSVVEVVLARASVTHWERGATIFSQDDPADAIHIVIDGWIKLYRIAPSGSEAVVGVFTKGQSFGEAVALQGTRYPVFAGTATDATVMRIEANELRKQLYNSPEVAISMLTATYAHLHHLVAQIEQLKAQTGPQRLADFLLDLTKTNIGPCSVQLPYDKVLIAGRLGMKPESLSRAFSKLKEQGVQVSQNFAEIEDVQALRAYAERDRAESWHRD